MSATDAPPVIREAWKQFELLGRRWDYSQVFSDLLLMSMAQCIKNDDIHNEHMNNMKKYTREEKDRANEFFRLYLVTHLEQTEKKGWFDFWGVLYECIVSRSKASNMGQFFTPDAVCEVLNGLMMGNETVEGKTMSDPACGSGRILLSAWHNHPKNYFCGEDKDLICARMCATNFALHGVKGEVINHDSLADPEGLITGYRVNYHPYYRIMNVPHIEVLTKPEQSKVCMMWRERRQENQKNNEDQKPPEQTEKGQLTIF